jgi:hypothetical protein
MIQGDIVKKSTTQERRHCSIRESWVSLGACMREGTSRNGDFRKGTTSMNTAVVAREIQHESFPSAYHLQLPNMASDATKMATTERSSPRTMPSTWTWLQPTPDSRARPLIHIVPTIQGRRHDLHDLAPPMSVDHKLDESHDTDEESRYLQHMEIEGRHA